MAKGTPFSLDGFKKNSDGTYQKISNPQPRDVIAVPINRRPEIILNELKKTGTLPCIAGRDNQYRTITLTLFGVPMPKQSVRSTNTGHHFQPQKMTDRKNDYIRQIRNLLPEGFVPFEKEVHVTKFHCIYPPLKAFHKIKGRMDAIRNGEIFYKNTQPDLIDNLKKLVFDSMAGIVFKNDGMIVTENDTAKYYGLGGCIIITLKGI